MAADNGVVLYTRSNFLRFDAISKGENKDIFIGLRDGTEKVETADTWRDFNSWVDYESLLEPEDSEEKNDALELMSFCVYNFAACVVNKEVLPPLNKLGRIPLRQWLSVDDLAFILGTLESCINKWIRQYWYLSEKKKKLLQEGKCAEDTKLLEIKLDRGRTNEMKKNNVKSEHERVKHLPGAKYESGSGIAGAKGQSRLAGLKVYIYRNYFEDTEFARRNEAALNSKLASMAEKDASEEDEEGADDDRCSLDARPPGMLDEIYQMEYAALLAD